MDKVWTITKNKTVLSEYEKFNIKKLPLNIYKNGVEKNQFDRTISKVIYECRKNSDEVFYEVFINFCVPIPLQFWILSLYEYEETYPPEKEFFYRAWRFNNRKEAIDKYLSLD